jgi:hypothetical protein
MRKQARLERIEPEVLCLTSCHYDVFRPLRTKKKKPEFSPRFPPSVETRASLNEVGSHSEETNLPLKNLEALVFKKR